MPNILSLVELAKGVLMFLKTYCALCYVEVFFHSGDCTQTVTVHDTRIGFSKMGDQELRICNDLSIMLLYSQDFFGSFSLLSSFSLL